MAIARHLILLVLWCSMAPSSGCAPPPAATTSSTTASVPVLTPFAGPPADLTDPEVVLRLSTLGAWGVVMRVLILNGTMDTPSECPFVDKDDLDHVVVTGGCTDGDGLEWVGTLEAEAQYTEEFVYEGTRLTASGFGVVGAYPCLFGAMPLTVRLDGTVSFMVVEGSFAVDMQGVMPHVDLASCSARDANFVLEYEAGANGVASGRYVDDVYGVVELETTATEPLYQPDVCDTEVYGGVTRLFTPDHEVTITYDGAVDCDDPGTATWTLDGVDQGEMVGVECASTPHAAGMLALVPLLALYRRRTA